ncbi:condensation domain-containing protein, partial [Nostoc sp. ChiSLP03a]|uniref:condensation domain-containing protein n=1 Tax=Nostoc sp. ChiSLP03a TaxID=3075380 RepID=UPI002AD377DD
MSLVEFLQDLSLKGIKLGNDGEKLRIGGSKSLLTPDVVAQLQQHKSEILQLLRDRPDILNIYPLSYGQQALWFLWQLAPESAAYNMVFACRICSQVNVTTLQKTFQLLINRHPQLRSTFSKQGNQVVQQICQTQLPDFQQINASNWSEQELEQRVFQEYKQPFDLENGSVIRVRLFTSSPQSHILLMSVHHIAGDGWSMPLLMEELIASYPALESGIEPSLTPLQHSYIDYIRWQRELLTTAQGEKLWNYWQQQLAGELPVLNLPIDKPRPPIQTYNGASHNFTLSPELTEKLKKLAQTEGVTQYILLLAAFQVLLYRYTGQEDILVGVPTSGRTQIEFAPIVGYFVDPVVIRANLSGNPSFGEFLAQIRSCVSQALAHQDFPFALLVERLQPQRDSSRSPIFQTVFNFILQNLGQFEQTQKLLLEGEVNQDGFILKPFEMPQMEGQFDLDLTIAENNSSLAGIFKYNTDLFDERTIKRIAENFITLLEGIVANPQEPISRLPLLTQPEQQQLLVEWNNTQADYSQDKCIHQLFEVQVERTPDAVAVVYENQQLTYQQLNNQANQLAHYLRSFGVKSDTLVGLCVERSLLTIVGILGILKAGGAYVPLDPEYPTERLSFMLEDAQVKVLVTQQQLVDTIPQHQAHIVCLDTDWEKIAQECELNPENTATPDNLAYVIYTSGSTGKPKGVLVNHSNVTRLFAATDSWYHFNQDDVWTMFHSYAFDFSVWEIWGALLYGGKLIVVPYLVTRSPESFYQLLCQEKVTILNQTPSAFRQLIQAEQSKRQGSREQGARGMGILPQENENHLAEAGDCEPCFALLHQSRASGSFPPAPCPLPPAPCPLPPASSLNLRLVIFGGEALELKSLQPWFERHGDISPQLVNMYGITETTVHVTYRPLSKADLDRTASVIGRPIPDLQVYILDEYFQPVPIGVPGEMYVGGAGVTRGYLNRPELTAERFISNPFDNSKKLYKTGDLARYLPDGELEYLGRIDNQVKIRGFRIELGEIEALLASYPAIWESIVAVREDEPGDKRLVAYVVPQKEQSPTVPELRQFLKAKLPEYMMPSAIVLLESLPLTSNGKVDRRALPTHELDSTLRELYVAPRTPTEEMLAQIWAQVLKLEQVGIHDNFFELGGHSLLATQLLSRIRNIFNVELPLRELFAASTVAELAQSIGQLLQQDSEITSPPLLRRTRDAELPLSYAQQRLWFLDQFEPNSPFYNIPMALRLVGNLDRVALEQSLQEIIHRHEALRTNFITVDGKPSQIIQTETTWTVSVVDLKHLSTTEREITSQQLAQQQVTQPFDLAKEALIRATLVVLNETEHVLLVCMHHVVSDGWSMGVFVQELAALYDAYAQGQPSPLAPLPIQYADFAIWQRNWLQGEVLQSQLNYWQQQLQDAPALLSLPTDRPRPAVQTYNGTHQEFVLSVELTNKLSKLSQEQGCTLFMTLLAAYDTLLYRYTGTEDILVGSPIANRDRSEIEGLIGFFVNTLVMRTSLTGNPSFSELLTRVRSMAMEAYSHQNLPFEMLVEALQPERNLSHTPLFQVMFVLQNAPTSELGLTGLTVNRLPIKGTTSRFDLTLSMENTATGLAGWWEYNTDLFDASTIERITSHFVTLLEGIVANPEQRISQLPLLTAVEQQQLLIEWNDTEVDYPLHKCIHQLFEEQVELTPDVVAVEFGNQQLTYKQLNYRANQLAHYLRSLGVKPDVLVGLCVERSLEMVIGLLAILKAGGAYVPLDSEYPSDRLSFILDDTQVKVLLTQQRFIDRLPPNQAKLVCLDTDAEDISKCSTNNVISGVQPNNLVYIIYTSGSTGQPKGIAMSQLALCNHILWHRDNLKIARGAKTLQFASISFDVSFQEIFTTWCSGGTLCLITEELRRDALALLGFLQEKQIQRMFLPVVGLQQLAEVALGNDIVNTGLREIITSGEQLQITPAISLWLSQLTDITLHNQYGPSESHLATS